MERVRKGQRFVGEQEELMIEHHILWYIDSCKKIKYMFRKLMPGLYCFSLRIAWHKIYYPKHIIVHFIIRANELLLKNYVCLLMKFELSWRNKEKLESTDTTGTKASFYLELVEEMQQRGIDFLPIDLINPKQPSFIRLGKLISL